METDGNRYLSEIIRLRAVEEKRERKKRKRKSVYPAGEWKEYIGQLETEFIR